MSCFEEMFEKISPEDQIREQPSYEEYLDSAWDTITTAEAVLGKLMEKEIEISVRVEHREELELRRQRMTLAEARQPSPSSSIGSTQIQSLLPRLQLPKFSGKLQEWDAFWAIFKTSIDEQPISSMMKYNYLLQALTGEAKQLANRFQLIEENYEVVIEALKKKFGRDSSIVEDLLAQLESCQAEGTTTKQQINLLDQLAAILTQLEMKGQDVNHRMILNTVLRKFQPDIQMKALEKRENLKDMTEWTWSTLQKHLSQILELKEKIERTQNRIIQKPTNTQGTPLKRSISPCIYCKRTNHRSVECRTVPESNRMAFLIRNHLCTNCGKPNHSTADCRTPGCFRCGLKHHSSLCRANASLQNTVRFQRNQERARPQSGQSSYQTQQRIQNDHSNRQGNRGQSQNTPRPVSQNVVTHEDEERRVESQSEDESNVYHVESQKQQKTGALLLTGTATITGPQGTKKVRIRHGYGFRAVLY